MSTYTQEAFNGGMNLLDNDTQLKNNEYRLGLNLRNRFGRLTPIVNGVEDVRAPVGLKQEIKTFGNYIILFVAGFAYYRHYGDVNYTKIPGFQMDQYVPRYWTEVVPITTVKFVRKLYASANDIATTVSQNFLGALAGTLSGLLVQDNINQPQFIYIDTTTGLPKVRNTQTYAEWGWTDDGSGNILTDNREYVPIGNAMAWVDGNLWIAAKNGESLYRSVSGRPLDFVVNIDINGDKGGDATTTAFSVGVGGITCLRAMSSGALFVAASNANFAVSKNNTIQAIIQTYFGEPTFIRTFLFNAVCLSDRVIIDSLGDTKFIDISGLRSFNAVKSLQNEGRNSPFSMKVQSVFNGIAQRADAAAAILYDNYELYGVNTILGPTVAVYDTITDCWTSFDLEQTNKSLIKAFAKIELSIQRLFCITADDKVFILYHGDAYAPMLRSLSISPDVLSIDGQTIPQEWEHKLQEVRCLFSGVKEDFTATITPIAQNNVTRSGTMTKSIEYSGPTTMYRGIGALDDMDTNIKTALFSTPDCNQSSQTYCFISWTGNVELQQFSFRVNDIIPINPLRSQS